MTPALLVRTSRRCSRFRKLSAEALMVARSARSRCRNSRRPSDDGWEFLISDMAASALSLERPAT